MVFMKLLKHHSLGRGVPWMSWVGSMKSTPQGCTVSAMWSWSCRVDGFFFFPSIKLDRPEGIFWDFQEKNLGGSRLVTSGHVFFLFSSFLEFLWTFFGFTPQKSRSMSPKKGHQNNWNRDTLLLFPELARGRYASETCLFFSQTDFPKKSKTIKRIVPRIHALDLPPTGNSHHQDRKHF